MRMYRVLLMLESPGGWCYVGVSFPRCVLPREAMLLLLLLLLLLSFFLAYIHHGRMIIMVFFSPLAPFQVSVAPIFHLQPWEMSHQVLWVAAVVAMEIKPRMVPEEGLKRLACGRFNGWMPR